RFRYLLSLLTAIAIFSGLSTVIFTPYSNYKDFYVVLNDIPFSHITKDEYDGGQWLRENIDIHQFPNSYIISDYATSIMMRSLTGLNTTAGRHPDMSPEKWDSMQGSIKTLFSSSVGNNTYGVLDNIRT